MIDFLDEKITSIKQRIAKFKKDYSELYEEENERKYNPNLDYQKLINEPLSPPISIKEWRQRVGEEQANKVAVQSSRRGTAVHQICEDFLSNKEDIYLKHMPNNVVMFKSIKSILERNINVVHHQEVPLYSNKLSIAAVSYTHLTLPTMWYV